MKKIVFSLLILFSIGCESEDDFSAWVNVDKVVKDDTLSVRREPSSNSDKVGSLAFDQKYIKVVDSIKVGKSTWINIETLTVSGWVNRFYTKKIEPKKFNETLKCSGTEPFWSLDIVNGGASYKNISQQQTLFAVSDILSSANHNNRWLITLINSGQEGKIFLSSTGSCSDDMSDLKYKYELALILPNKKLYTGCCNVVE